MIIPDAVRTCVVYLGIDARLGTAPKIKYGGTGFFVAIPAKQFPEAGFMFLVTAKHVADKLAGKKFYIRANTKDGKSFNLQAADNIKWYFHPTDQAADVALMPISLDQSLFEFTTLAPNMILTEAIRREKGIGIGDSVFITGLFVHHAGFAKNIPILRTGNIAMIPDERIPIKNFGDMEAYLIEARSIGGLSGSPVFTIARSPEQATVYLMGLMHGHWAVDSETVIDEIEQDAGIKAGVNVGIAIVTPASKILDIINGDELSKTIETYEAQEAARILAHNTNP